MNDPATTSNVPSRKASQHHDSGGKLPSVSSSSSLRRGSYLLVSQEPDFGLGSGDQVHPDLPPVPDAPTYTTPIAPHPRFYLILPLLAAFDFALTLGLGIVILIEERKRAGRNSGGDAGRKDRTALTMTVVGVGAMRAASVAVVGVSRRVRELGVVVAAICLASTLFAVSVANLLFQARRGHSVCSDSFHVSHSHHTGFYLPHPSAHPFFYAFPYPHPTLPILAGIQLALTLVEWISYIAVVGVRVPPGPSRLRAARWARELRASDVQGLDVRSVYDETFVEDEDDGEDDEDLDAEEEERAEAEGQLAGEAGFSHSATRSGSGHFYAEPEEVDRDIERGPRTPEASSSGSVLRASSALGRSGSRTTSADDGGHAFEGHSTIAQNERDGRDSDGEDDAEGEEDLSADPDDIVDITPNRALSRQASRRRLALAAHPNRSSSTWSTILSPGRSPRSPRTPRLATAAGMPTRPNLLPYLNSSPSLPVSPSHSHAAASASASAMATPASRLAATSPRSETDPASYGTFSRSQN